MPRPWPIGSTSRIVADLDSGTKIAVSKIASAQIGRLIQNTERQSTNSMSAPPTIGPERHRDADDATPDADRAGALHAAGEHLGDDRHRHRIHHRAADGLQEPRRDQRLDVRREAAQQ